jgi:hypothetical protein
VRDVPGLLGSAGNARARTGFVTHALSRLTRMQPSVTDMAILHLSDATPCKRRENPPASSEGVSVLFHGSDAIIMTGVIYVKLNLICISALAIPGHRI